MYKLCFPSTTPQDIQMAGTVAKVVELVDLRMVSGEFGPAARAGKGPKAKSGNAPYAFGFKHQLAERENRLEVAISIEGQDIHSASGEQAGESGLRVKAAFLLIYQLMVEPPPEDIRDAFFAAFARINGLMHAWPYFREFAHEAARRMGFPSLVVPLLRVEPKPESETEPGRKKTRVTSPRKTTGSRKG